MLQSNHKSLSRLVSHNQKYEIGAITAYRKYNGCDESKGVLTTKQNNQRNKGLAYDLTKRGYGLIKVVGKYPEGGNLVSEVSFIVVDKDDTGKLKDDLILLGKKYYQDSILHIEKGVLGGLDKNAKAVLYGTNNCPNNDIKIGKKHILGKSEIGKTEEEVITKLGNRPLSFKWSNISTQAVEEFDTKNKIWEGSSYSSQFQKEYEAKVSLSQFSVESNIVRSELSSLSRLQSHSSKYDTGTISAFRDNYSLKQNLVRNKKLKLELESLGFGVTTIKGVGQEDGKAVEEWSFFVADVKNKGNLKDVLISLGVEFEQDSITFAKAGNNPYYLISTNKNPRGTGGGKIGVEIKLGRPNFGKDGEFFSKIRGRPFLFSLASNGLEVVESIHTQQAKRLWAKSSLEKLSSSFFSSVEPDISSTDELEAEDLNHLVDTGGLK